MDASAAVDQVELRSAQAVAAVAASTSAALRCSRPTGAASGRSGSSSFLFVASLFAEFIANDRPIIASYKGEILFPVFNDYPESKFGGFLAETDFRDPFIQEEIDANGWMVWPPIRYSLPDRQQRAAAAGAVAAGLPAVHAEACARYQNGVDDMNCMAAT